MKRLALLISGGGTTAEAIIQSCREGKLQGLIDPVLVISSNGQTGGWSEGMRRACKAGVPFQDGTVINPKDFTDKKEFGHAIIDQCHTRNVDIIGQYGWLVKTPQVVIEKYPNTMINQHPGPIDPGHSGFGGDFMFGRRVHCARLLFVRKTKRDYCSEAVAQRVHANFDEGAVLKTERVEILPSDDVETLRDRVLKAEYRVQIDALFDFARDTVKEVVRSERLVLPDEEMTLQESKCLARLLYPRG